MEQIRLGAILLEGGLVDEAGLERCLAIQALTGGTRPLGQVLVEQGLIQAKDLERVLGLQRSRSAALGQVIEDADIGCASLLAAAQAQHASEVVVSEGQPVRMRVAGEWRRLTNEALRGPEVWEFVRELMGAEVLEALAERQYVVHAWDRGVLGRGSATAFRQFEGVAARVTFTAAQAPTPEQAGMPPAFVDAVRSGKGLVLVVGERGVGHAEALAPLVQLAAREPDHYVVVVDDEPLPLPADGALVVRRRYGISPRARAATLRSVVREDPDTLVVADVGSPETFELALRAAEGGRLVIAYLDAGSVTSALQRVLNFYPDYDLPRVRATVAAVLRAVFVRHVVPDVTHQHDVAATELLLVDDAVREVLRHGELADLGLLIRADGSRSGHSLDRNLLELVAAGRVRLDDVFARAEEKAWLLERTKDLLAN